MTPDELAKILAKPGYSLVASGVRHAVPKSADGKKPLCDDEVPQRGAGRAIVCITRYSTGSLDRDNLWGSAKGVCDALRYAGRIPDDDAASIVLVVRQRKSKRKNQGTEILILPL